MLFGLQLHAGFPQPHLPVGELAEMGKAGKSAGFRLRFSIYKAGSMCY